MNLRELIELADCWNKGSAKLSDEESSYLLFLLSEYALEVFEPGQKINEKSISIKLTSRGKALVIIEGGKGNRRKESSA